MLQASGPIPAHHTAGHGEPAELAQGRKGGSHRPPSSSLQQLRQQSDYSEAPLAVDTALRGNPYRTTSGGPSTQHYSRRHQFAKSYAAPDRRSRHERGGSPVERVREGRSRPESASPGRLDGRSGARGGLGEREGKRRSDYPPPTARASEARGRATERKRDTLTGEPNNLQQGKAPHIAQHGSGTPRASAVFSHEALVESPKPVIGPQHAAQPSPANHNQVGNPAPVGTLLRDPRSVLFVVILLPLAITNIILYAVATSTFWGAISKRFFQESWWDAASFVIALNGGSVAALPGVSGQIRGDPTAIPDGVVSVVYPAVRASLALAIVTLVLALLWLVVKFRSLVYGLTATGKQMKVMRKMEKDVTEDAEGDAPSRPKSMKRTRALFSRGFLLAMSITSLLVFGLFVLTIAFKVATIAEPAEFEEWALNLADRYVALDPYVDRLKDNGISLSVCEIQHCVCEGLIEDLSPATCHALRGLMVVDFILAAGWFVTFFLLLWRRHQYGMLLHRRRPEEPRDARVPTMGDIAKEWGGKWKARLKEARHQG